jgi:Fur family transcriptional regulator, ferric uptake regulator
MKMKSISNKKTSSRKPAPETAGPVCWHKNLKGQGYRITRGRKAILEVLAGAEGHLSAEDIYLKVHPVLPAIGLTSVYRTLEILSRLGLIFRFDFGDGRGRFELAEAPGGERHHHHLVCTGCGRVIDYKDFIDKEKALLKKTEAGLSKKYRFRITNHQIQFYGLCDQCVKKGESKSGRG